MDIIIKPHVQDMPGKLLWIDKKFLHIDDSYQRNASPTIINSFVSSWSWIACGVITVGRRPDNTYSVMDGQHRVLSAMKREDITHLPCIVFNVNEIKNEAKGFLEANTHRKLMLSAEKFKAGVVAEDSLILKVKSILEANNIEIKQYGSTPNSLGSLKRCMVIANRNISDFEIVIRLISKLCVNERISEDIILGMDYLYLYCTIPLSNKNLESRILDIGIAKINKEISNAKLMLGSGGGKNCALGILTAINKNIRNKYTLK